MKTRKKKTASLAVLVYEEGVANLQKDYDESTQEYGHDPSLTVRFDISLPTKGGSTAHHRGYLRQIENLSRALAEIDKQREEKAAELNRILLETVAWHGRKF